MIEPKAHHAAYWLLQLSTCQAILAPAGSAGSEENCYSIHIVNLAYVKDMQLGECVDTVEDPPPQDVSQVVQHYKAAVKEARRKGVNVSAKEQHIFDQLHKMLVQYIWKLAQMMHAELFTCTKL